MIHFISGNPGGGKSFYAVRQILFELQHTDRVVVTNLALKLEALEEYLSKSEWWKGGHVLERVRLLKEEETKEFFRFRGGAALPMVDNVSLGFAVPDFSGIAARGVLYVIDELHVHFGAREWFKTGQAVIWYQTQHRKLGDDVILISQHPDQVDKAFRRLAQDWTYLRNLGQEKTLGFTAKNWLRRTTYLRPKGLGDNQAAQETGLIRLDVSGLCQLYDTNAGVGILGRVDARKESKARGLPWWTAPLFALGVVFLIWLGINGVFAGFKFGMKKAVGVGSGAVHAMVGGSTNPPGVTGLSGRTVFSSAPVVTPAVVEAPRLVQVVILGNQSRWGLSNGQSLRLGHPEFLMGGEDWVVTRSWGRLDRGILAENPVNWSTPLSQNETLTVSKKDTDLPKRWSFPSRKVPIFSKSLNTNALDVLRSIH